MCTNLRDKNSLKKIVIAKETQSKSYKNIYIMNKVSRSSVQEPPQTDCQSVGYNCLASYYIIPKHGDNVRHILPGLRSRRTEW